MKEIDLLPDWYKKNNRRRLNARSHYIALVGLFVVIVVWNFIATGSVSKAEAELAKLDSKLAEAQKSSQKFESIKDELKQLKKKTEMLEEIDSKIDVASVLAEISFLIDQKVVLSELVLSSEPFGLGSGTVKGRNSIRKANRNMGGKSLGQVRFKVQISGIAVEAGDVAELICKLEESPYFFQVYPSFSRDREINAKVFPYLKSKSYLDAAKYKVSEFKIGCYLANYQQGQNYFVKNMQSTSMAR